VTALARQHFVAGFWHVPAYHFELKTQLGGAKEYRR
jgi:hypothetical protein